MTQMMESYKTKNKLNDLVEKMMTNGLVFHISIKNGLQVFPATIEHIARATVKLLLVSGGCIICEHDSVCLTLDSLNIYMTAWSDNAYADHYFVKKEELKCDDMN